MRVIDTERFSRALRKKAVDLMSRKVLIARYDGAQQLEDLTLAPNCQGWGRIHHFRRWVDDHWPANPLPIDPALLWLGMERSDALEVQLFQIAVCSWRCWYCYVDFELLSASRSHADFKTVDDLIDLYLAESDRPPIIDLSGGQPDLVPEWTLWFADGLVRRGLETKVYLWSDDNLSNDYLWRYLSAGEVERLASYRNYGRVGCFKGFDEQSFTFNTTADPGLFRLQFELMRRIVRAGFDVYGYATFTSDDGGAVARRMCDFVDRLQEAVHPLFPLRTVPLRIRPFTPTVSRMRAEHARALEIQNEAVAAWSEELQRRFPPTIRERRIYENRLE